MLCAVPAANGSWSYDFGVGWVREDMGVPRVMGDATLLPNGDVILLNGAQVCSRDHCLGQSHSFE